MRWMKLKTRTETPSRTGTMVRLRRMAYRPTSRSPFFVVAPRPAGPQPRDGLQRERRYGISTVLKYSDPVGCGT